jgi:hypothetical protein
MTDTLPRPGLPPILPYAIGAFMAMPLVLWAVLWLFVFPGDKNGFDSELTTVLLVGSAPLVLWFLICSLGFIANSMAGASEFERPRDPIITLVISVLPQSAVCLGLAGSLYMLSVNATWYAIAAPLALGLLIGYSIREGERARTRDARMAEAVGFRGRTAASGSIGAAGRHRLLWSLFAGLAGLLVALQWTTDERIVVAGFATAAVLVFATLTLLGPSGEDRAH